MAPRTLILGLVAAAAVAACQAPVDVDERARATCAAMGHDLACVTAFHQGYDDQLRAGAPLSDDAIRAAWGESQAAREGYVGGVHLAQGR